MIDKLLSLIAPHYCYGCGQMSGVMCDNCKYNIINESYDVCIGCGGATASRGVCGSCTLPYSRAWVVDGYHGPLGEAIKGMKIVSVQETADVLGEILAEVVPSLPSHVVIVPIPTVRSHVRQRGFDHTGRIARIMAKQQGVSVGRVLRRVGRASQRGATARQRTVQAKGAFAVHGRLDPDRIYLVIDDVVTTGATIREAGLRLQEAGAKELWVAAVARESLD